MRKMSSVLIGLTTTLALTVAACGGDPTGVDSGDQLTATEVAAVLAAFGSAFDLAGTGAQPAPMFGPAGAGAARTPIPFSESFDESVPCDSGTVQVSGSVSGSVDDVTFDMDITMDVSMDPNGCVVSDGTNTFTLDGAPRINLLLTIVSTPNALTVSGTETGGFSFTSSDGRAGSCALDVTFSVITGDTGISSTVTGTICGLAAEGFDTFGT